MNTLKSHQKADPERQLHCMTLKSLTKYRGVEYDQRNVEQRGNSWHFLLSWSYIQQVNESYVEGHLNMTFQNTIQT